MNEQTKQVLIWVTIGLVLLMVFNNFSNQVNPKEELAYSDFLKRVSNHEIESVTINKSEYPNAILAKTVDGVQLKTYDPGDKGLMGDLIDNQVKIITKPPQNRSILMEILINSVPLLIFIGLMVFVMRQMQGGAGGKGAMSFGKSKARMLSEDQIKVSFADMAGAEEAKEEVSEVVDFLRDPAKFQKLGGKIPRGVLMVGSPGTGKTLLARAIAGEAKVPFFTISGSDFVEMFVGVGASRVRDMFEQAKKHAPCIIFIDEIDAVGRHRGAGVGGGHDEREQTLNQLLVEMDGFEGNEGVIVIAATNRPDVLDPALLRPGRFDRQVTVPLPDIRGREAILKVHMRKVPMGDNVKVSIIARGTPGFSGADLANLVNEAALFAARDDKTIVDMEDLEKAKDKILMGTERRSMVMKDDEKEMTAYHEAGHAIVGRLVPSHDPVYKVSIIPRGRALGVTMFLPEEDRYSHSKELLESNISSLFGGRIAEELIYGKDKVTTGASNDIERATSIARNMVVKWGFSDKLGPLLYSEDEEEVFLGRSVTQHKNVSDETAHLIDSEIRSFIDKNYHRAETLLKENIDILHAMTKALVKYETIDANMIDDLMARLAVREPKDWIDEDDDNEKPIIKSKIVKKSNKKPKDDGLGNPAGQH